MSFDLCDALTANVLCTNVKASDPAPRYMDCLNLTKSTATLVLTQAVVVHGMMNGGNGWDALYKLESTLTGNTYALQMSHRHVSHQVSRLTLLAHGIEESISPS
jgi:hypothetical protein